MNWVQNCCCPLAILQMGNPLHLFFVMKVASLALWKGAKMTRLSVGPLF